MKLIDKDALLVTKPFHKPDTGSYFNEGYRQCADDIRAELDKLPEAAPGTRRQERPERGRILPDDITDQAIRERVVQVISRSDLSLGELSKQTGINRDMVSRYANGSNAPGTCSLAKLCAALGISADWVLGLTDQKEG